MARLHHTQQSSHPSSTAQTRFAWLKKSFSERLIERLFRDYALFRDLPFQTRLQGALALVLVTETSVFALHLALLPTTISAISIVYLYSISALASAYIFFIVLYPQLQQQRYFVMYIVVAALLGLVYGYLSGAGVIRPGKLFFPSWESAILFGLITASASGGIHCYRNVMSAMIRQRSRMTSELDAARIIHQRFVPECRLATPHYEAFGKSLPSSEVGGDYFDVVQLSEQEVAVAVGDVSGHGVAAGLLMAVVKSAFRTELKHLRSAAHLPDLMRSLNEIICDNAERGMFVSFQCVVFNFVERTCTLCNAGHLPVLRARPSAAAMDELRTRGMALGLARQAVFSAETFSVQTGDVFLFLTDGVTEAANAANAEFGLDAVKRVLKQHGGSQSPEQLYTTTLSHLRAFAGGTTAKFQDDATMLVLRIAAA
jgi:serine phosphatase RsbU (regulator of sigma subunit)